MKIDLNCPVENRGAVVKTSTKTNESYAILKLYNLSDLQISSVELSAKVYDTYGKELGTIPVNLTDLDAEPKSFFAQNKAISLKDFSEAKHIVPEFNRVVFTDESEYVSDGNYIDITISEPDPAEADRLKEVAGQDAVCYAKDPGEYWLCVCGRPNDNYTERCTRCEREKKYVMDKFSSRQLLNNAYEEKKIADDRAELERYKAIEKNKLERKQRILKNSVRVALGALCLAVLCVVGYFIYSFTVTQIANIHAKNENYLKAYEMYSSVNSSSIGKASEHVRGNSASNLFASGILTEDNKNYYYINAKMQIIIENKETATIKNTGISGLSLNAVDGTLYYISVDDSNKIYKLDPDTLDTLPVNGAEDVTAYSLSVIGNDIYYFTAESAGEGEQAQQIPVLYKLKEGKKPHKISDLPIQVFDVYKGKTYFITNDQTRSLCVIDKPGAEPKVIVEGPIYQFEIKDDFIYYLDYTIPADSTDGLPALSINKTDMNGEFISKLTGDHKAVYFLISNDKLYFGDYSNDVYFSCVSTNGGEISVISETPYNIVNVKGNLAVALDTSGNMVKIDLTTGETTNLQDITEE